ncbi:MAG: hypothetical protein J6X99_06260 [Bacteroidales bacterium]|nr:hypothetical protein [Bacteroidales bacterium]
MKKEIVGKDAFGMGKEQAEERTFHRVEINFHVGIWQQNVPAVLPDTRGYADCMLSCL